MSRIGEALRLKVVYPLAEMVKGTNSMLWFRRIEELQSKSADDIRAWQNGKLRILVDHAYNHTSYYHALFDDLDLTPEDIKTVDDLKKLPILTKDKIRSHFEDIVPDNVSEIRHRVVVTGGTTGDPMKYLCDEDLWGFVTANKIHAWKTTGYRFGDAFLALGSASLFGKKASFSRRCIDLIRNEMAVNSLNMDDDVCRKYVEMIVSRRIHYLYGYASALYLLAKFVKDNSLKVDCVSRVFTTSENLTPVYRNVIESAFNCKVMDCYGARDAGLSSYEVLPGKHFVGYCSYLELEDRFETDKGRLLATNLLNLSFPLLHYDFGDCAQLIEGCTAYNGQVIGEVYGRVSDVLRLDNGKVLTSPGFTILMNGFDVNAFNIEKLSGNHVKLQIDKKPTFSPSDEDALKSEVKRYIGEETTLSIEYVPGFAPLPNGKRRYFMNDSSSENQDK